MARTSSVYDNFYHLTFKCDLDRQPTRTNVSNGTSTRQGELLCQTILKYMHKCRSYGPDKSGRTHAQRTHIHRTDIVTTMSRSSQAGSTKMPEKHVHVSVLPNTLMGVVDGIHQYLMIPLFIICQKGLKIIFLTPECWPTASAVQGSIPAGGDNRFSNANETPLHINNAFHCHPLFVLI